MIRAIALSLALLLGIGVIVPLATDYAEAGAKKHRKYAKKKKKIKKYSKQWWRQYRARMKRKKSLQARKRALRLRQLADLGFVMSRTFEVEAAHCTMDVLYDMS